VLALHSDHREIEALGLCFQVDGSRPEKFRPVLGSADQVVAAGAEKTTYVDEAIPVLRLDVNVVNICTTVLAELDATDLAKPVLLAEQAIIGHSQPQGVLESEAEPAVGASGPEVGDGADGLTTRT
jgi:hypothetical protein